MLAIQFERASTIVESHGVQIDVNDTRKEQAETEQIVTVMNEETLVPCIGPDGGNRNRILMVIQKENARLLESHRETRSEDATSPAYCPLGSIVICAPSNSNSCVKSWGRSHRLVNTTWCVHSGAARIRSLTTRVWPPLLRVSVQT